MKLHLIAAARPNFMKIAPLYHELQQDPLFDVKIIHTGQHYDKNMSDTFFTEFKLPAPHHNLGIGGGTQAEQVGYTMIAYEKVCISERPDLVIVVGDVNATVACSITAKKLHIPVAHLEAGIRSFDISMPEEINRMLTDRIADYFWTPSADADTNLLNEGISPQKITMVGNIMIDTLEMMRSRIETAHTVSRFHLAQKQYAVCTFHRPSNVDSRSTLEKLLRTLVKVSETTPLIFPIHPRTKKNIATFALDNIIANSAITLTEPLGYSDFMHLVFNAKFILTDSGGIQEETTYLGIPCLTVRNSTERPITIWEGTNALVSVDHIVDHVYQIEHQQFKKGKVPDLWDGNTAHRIATILRNIQTSDKQK